MTERQGRARERRSYLAWVESQTFNAMVDDVRRKYLRAVDDNDTMRIVHLYSILAFGGGVLTNPQIYNGVDYWIRANVGE